MSGSQSPGDSATAAWTGTEGAGGCGQRPPEMPLKTLHDTLSPPEAGGLQAWRSRGGASPSQA